MTTLMRLLLPPLAVLMVAADPNWVHAQNSNTPPEVSIVWPANYCLYAQVFQRLSCLKIKALASDPDGSVAQVQFFENGLLIGAATNAPFELVWFAAGNGTTTLKAVAYDNVGAISESLPVSVYLAEFGGSPRAFEIRSPMDRGVFASPATFEFSAELLVSPHCDTGRVEFFVGTNLVGVITQAGPLTEATPLYTLTVTNVPEGEYQLSVRKDSLLTAAYAPGSCDPVFIRVTKLGVASSYLTPDGRFEFDVVTSFPTNEHVIEASSNLLNWTPISTNVPFMNTFLFTDPSPATNSPRFYRAIVPSQ